MVSLVTNYFNRVYRALSPKPPVLPFLRAPDAALINIRAFLDVRDASAFSCSCRTVAHLTASTNEKTGSANKAMELRMRMERGGKATPRRIAEFEAVHGKFDSDQVTHLDLAWSRLDVEAIKKLILRFPGLKTIKLFYCKAVNDELLLFIAKKCPLLQSLNLSYCSLVTDKGVIAIAACKQLSNLILHECSLVTDEGIKALAACTRLERLNLAYCTRVTDAGIIAIAACTQLEHLSLCYCVKITDAGIIPLAACTKLQHLDLFGCRQVTDAGIIPLAACGLLRALHLGGCVQVTNAGISSLAACTQLRELRLNNCFQVTDAGIRPLAACTQLRELNLFNCEKVTDEGISVFANHDIDIYYHSLTRKSFRKPVPPRHADHYRPAEPRPTPVNVRTIARYLYNQPETPLLALAALTASVGWGVGLAGLAAWRGYAYLKRKFSLGGS